MMNDFFIILCLEVVIKLELVCFMVLLIVNCIWDFFNKLVYFYFNGWWKDEVVLVCNDIIVGCYLFDLDVVEDVSFEDFIDFLGLFGVVDVFYNDYLKLFIVVCCW